MRYLVPSLVALALPAMISSVHAQTLDCSALANSHLPEPAGYAAQCGAPTPQPSIVSTRAPTDLAFTVEVRGNGAARPANTLYSFTLNDFATQTSIGATNPSVFAMDFTADGSTLYAITGAAAAVNPSTFGTISTATGAFTPIAAVSGANAGFSASGLTIDPLTGDAYVSSFENSTAMLYSIDLASGAVTQIGSMGTNIIIDIAMNCEGDLYGHDIGQDGLVSIDPTTGAATLIGLHGLAANFAQGMDFDNDDGTLYGFVYTGGGTNRFGTFDLTTGAFTTLVQDNPLGEYEGAIPTQGPVTGTPAVGLSTPTIDFGVVAVGATSATLTQTFTNTGDGPGEFTWSAPTAPFAIVGSSCGAQPAVLAVGETCTLSYTFSPTVGGAANQAATVTAAGSAPTTFALSGFGGVVSEVRAIPSLGQWGMLLMGALMLLVVGRRFASQRQS